jgi:hypothetical protein
MRSPRSDSKGCKPFGAMIVRELNGVCARDQGTN